MSKPNLDLKPHPIVERLVKDPGAPPETSQFLGYIGQSSRPEHVRVYVSLALDEFVDVPEAAVLHAEDVPDTELAHGGTRLWVDARAEVIHEIRQSERTEARFLEGSIASAHLKAEPAERARTKAGGVTADAMREPAYGDSVNICAVRTVIGSCDVGCPLVTRPIRSLCLRLTCVSCPRSCIRTTCPGDCEIWDPHEEWRRPPDVAAVPDGLASGEAIAKASRDPGDPYERVLRAREELDRALEAYTAGRDAPK
jgi:hypothetical protein